MSFIEIILGPTNTGKTFYAFEQMFLYKNGAFGFPLRLLARENYDKACKLYAVDEIALITGEEKIIPKNAKYFFCTVESMPEKNFEFICVDEIQLTSDYERGHIFSQKLLYVRGEHKTIFLGSSVMENLIRELIPDAEIKFKNRFSELSFIAHKKIQNIKPRSAIIAFNLIDLYEVAEQIRMLKGGVALVVGALSPKTRNAQVKLYEDGDVDYIVATDAIGMGLNLDITQVYFTSLEKFDGKYVRPLNDLEIAQIAGRAGRYTKAGFFGSTLNARFQNKETVDNIQLNKFEPIKKIFWRNPLLSFKSPYDLIRSLRVSPPNPKLVLKKDAADQKFLMKFLGDYKKKYPINTPEELKNLWDICRIPDFQNISDEKHLILLANVYGELFNNEWKLSEDFLRSNITKLEDYKGNINDLIYNLNETRTWLYITNHNKWLHNNNWIKVVEEIENKLSDEIHNSLLQKFVDKNQSAIVQNLNLSSKNINMDDSGYISIKTEIIGKLEGFRLVFYDKFNGILNENYKKIIIEEISSKILMNLENFISAPDNSLKLSFKQSANGNLEGLFITWGDDDIAQITKGESLLRPHFKLLVEEKIINSDEISKIQNKINDWIQTNIVSRVDPGIELMHINNTVDERAFIFSLMEGNFNIYKKGILDDFKKIDENIRKKIHGLNFRLGKNIVFNSELLRPELMSIKFYLWGIFYDIKYKVSDYIPRDGNSTIVFNKNDKDLYTFLGFHKELDFLIRLDVYNEFEKGLFKRESRGPYALPIDLSNLLGIKKDKLIEILSSRNMQVLPMGENDYMVFKTNPIMKNNIKEKQKPKIKSPPKQVKQNKTLFNNPFNDLTKLNV
jgi:ATP-dependent RNA helicase SUPV3L1/SUV3|tara:strand:+ start:248 stop:2782 length:2535 start_codon:yes stop_codon:yes gene_type:complete